MDTPRILRMTAAALSIGLAVAAVCLLNACGAGGGEGGDPVTKTFYLSSSKQGTVAMPQGSVWLDECFIGDNGPSVDYTGLTWVNISSIPLGAAIDSATLIAPVTNAYYHPDQLGAVVIDIDGRMDEVGPSPADALMLFENEDVATIVGPEPSSRIGNLPDEFRADVASVIQGYVAQGMKYALFRVYFDAGGNNDSYSDKYVLGGTWGSSGLSYPWLLRVTYTL